VPLVWLWKEGSRGVEMRARRVWSSWVPWDFCRRRIEGRRIHKQDLRLSEAVLRLWGVCGSGGHSVDVRLCPMCKCVA